MGMLKHEDVEALEREVHQWLEIREIPLQDYRKLPAYYKGLLHNLVCTPTGTTSPSERRALYRKLCRPESRAGKDITVDPVDSMTDEKLRQFFSPLTCDERRHYQSKY